VRKALPEACYKKTVFIVTLNITTLCRNFSKTVVKCHKFHHYTLEIFIKCARPTLHILVA